MVIVLHSLYPSCKLTANLCVFVDAHFTGNATRHCFENLTRADTDVTNCQSQTFLDIMERVCVLSLL